MTHYNLIKTLKQKHRLLSILFLYFIFLSNTANSQTINIKGEIYDASNDMPLEGVAVILNNSIDSAFISGTVSDLDGKFHIEKGIKGDLYLQFSYIGYNTLMIPLNTASQSQFNLGKIELSTSDIKLKEVVVKGKQPDIRIKNDTIEYNASSYKTQKSAVVEDLLKKLPGIEFTDDGKIIVNGQEIKQILIDGKEFFGNDTKIAMKYISAELIESLQIVERKSDLEEITGIDDGNRNYVINLKLKRDMSNGVLGSVTGGASLNDRYDINAMINYFENERKLTVLAASNNINEISFSDILKGVPSQVTSQLSQSANDGRGEVKSNIIGMNYADLLLSKKLKIDGNVFVAEFSRNEDREMNRHSFKPENLNYLNQTQHTFNTSRQFKSGWIFDYRPTKKTRILFRPDIIFGKGNNEININNENLDGDAAIIDSTYNNNKNRDNNFFMKGVFIINHNLKKKGRSISLEAAAEKSETINNADLQTDKIKFTSSDISKPVDMPLSWFLTDRTTTKTEYRGRVNYSEPLTKTMQATFSYQFKRAVTISDKATDKWNVKTQEFEFSPSQTDRFDNVFNNNRIELGIRKYWKAINVRLGAAVEPSEMYGYSYKADTLFYKVKKETMDVSPYVYFICPFSKEKILRFDLWAFTRQPTGLQLQPIRDESNPNFLREGNPDLNPIITTRFRLRYNGYNKITQQTIVLNMGADIVKNSITNKTEFIEDGVQLTKPVNIDGIWNSYFTFMYNIPLGTHFRFSSYTTGNYNKNINFISDRNNPSIKNENNYLKLREKLQISCRNEHFEIGLKAEAFHVYSDYLLTTKVNMQSTDIIAGSVFEVRFPNDWGGISVDYNYGINKGYFEGFQKNEHLLNAQLNLSLFKNKNGTLSLKGYDILDKRRSVIYNMRPNYIENLEFETLSRYFILQFSYRFNYFSKMKL